MRLISKLRGLIGWREEDPREVLAQLLLATKDDPAFRHELLSLLQAPAAQRQSLVNTALHEMMLRGEPNGARAAFAMLATDEGARVALEVLLTQ